MDVLRRHQEQRQKMGGQFDELLSLHEQLYQLWEEIVHLQNEDEYSRDLKDLEAQHARTMEIAGRILQVRNEAFGGVNYLSELDIISKVDSMAREAAQRQAMEAGPSPAQAA